MSVQYLQSPIGILTLQAEEDKLTRVEFLFGRKTKPKQQTPRLFEERANDSLKAFTSQELELLSTVRYKDVYQTNRLLEKAKQELNEYFEGRRKNFDLPIKPHGTLFQQQVWSQLATVPYGEVQTYGSLAFQIGRPKSARAIGAAMRENPIGIVLPCHRIVGASGSLTGYNGGLYRKTFLLNLEANVLSKERSNIK